VQTVKNYSLVAYLNLTRAFAVSDFKLRFHGSVLGIFWSFLRPFLMFSVLYVVFSTFVRFDIPYYALYLLLGVILWNFFAEATVFSIVSLDSKGPLLRKIYFPRSIVIVSAVATSGMSLLFNLVVFFILFFITGPTPSVQAFLFLPFLLCLFFITLGMAFCVTAFFPRFRDIRQIWDVLLQIGFFATPILYSVSAAHQNIVFLILLNPLARVIPYSRAVLLGGALPGAVDVIVLMLMTTVIFFVGYVFYSKRSRTFAEDL
jgi:ABC-type polysaccharide/polyol phosphate export permease